MTARDIDRLSDEIAEHSAREIIRLEMLAKRERDTRRMLRDSVYLRSATVSATVQEIQIC